jgi:hypothetical protein
MPCVSLQLYPLARVKPIDGVYQSQNAVPTQIIPFDVGREMSVNVESNAPYQRQHFGEQAFPDNVAIQTPSVRITAERY